MRTIPPSGLEQSSRHFNKRIPFCGYPLYPYTVSPHVSMIAPATSRAPLLAVRNRTRGIRSLFVMAEKKQWATPDKAVKHKYPLEVCSLCLDPPQVFD